MRSIKALIRFPFEVFQVFAKTYLGVRWDYRWVELVQG